MIVDNILELEKKKFPVIIVGSGPAGISAALKLGEHKINCLIIESGHLDDYEDSDKFLMGDTVGDEYADLSTVRVKKFADGRIFSIGNLLRLKYKYKNELRAIGDVLRDQLFFLKRSGFNSFHIREDRDAKDALLGLNDFTTPYQGAVDQKQPAWKILKR